MLTAIETANRTVGRHLRNPSEADNAAAQTASSAPDTTRINHAMTNLHESVLSWCGYCSLVRGSHRRTLVWILGPLGLPWQSCTNRSSRAWRPNPTSARRRSEEHSSERQ